MIVADHVLAIAYPIGEGPVAAADGATARSQSHARGTVKTPVCAMPGHEPGRTGLIWAREPQAGRAAVAHRL